MTVTLEFETNEERERAAAFIAELVRQGVTFEAREAATVAPRLIVTFTGGF